jgi:hypothetical protein
MRRSAALTIKQKRTVRCAGSEGSAKPGTYGSSARANGNRGLDEREPERHADQHERFDARALDHDGTPVWPPSSLGRLAGPSAGGSPCATI